MAFSHWLTSSTYNELREGPCLSQRVTAATYLIPESSHPQNSPSLLTRTPMTTTATPPSKPLQFLNGPVAIKRKPRLPRHQRAGGQPYLDDMDTAAQLAAAAKKLHMTTMELIQRTLAAKFQYEATYNAQSATPAAASASPTAWQAPQTETASQQASVSLLH